MYKAEQFAEIKETEILSIVSKLKKENFAVTFNAAITTNSFYVGFYTNEDIYKKIRISDHDASLNENFANLEFSEIFEIYNIIKENGRKLRKEVIENSFYTPIFDSFEDIKEETHTIKRHCNREGSTEFEARFFKKANSYFYKIKDSGYEIEIDSVSFLKRLTTIKTTKKTVWR